MLCGINGHQARQCVKQGCTVCKKKHHTSLHDDSYGATVKNTLSKALKAEPVEWTTKSLITIHGEASPKRLPRFEFEIQNLEAKSFKTDAIAVNRDNLGSLRRTPMNKLKEKYSHLQGKPVYSSDNDYYEIHMVIGVVLFNHIRFDVIIKGKEGEPVIEWTKFGWTIHGGAEGIIDMCLFTKSSESEYRELYSWDILGLKDEAEHSQVTVYDEFNENIVRNQDGRFEVKLPWVPNHPELKTNEGPARKRLHNVMRKLSNDPETKQAYDKIIEQQLEEGIIELAPQNPDGSRVFYMPHKSVVRTRATTTRVRMVHDASAKPSSEDVSLNVSTLGLICNHFYMIYCYE